MNYYQFHIGDFNNATRHLTRVERSVYRDAIELYYDTEQPLNCVDFDKLAKRLLCVTHEEKTALQDVLDEFFIADGTQYRHERCDAEIAKYHANTSAKALAGKASAAKRQQNSTAVEQTLNTCATNQEPRTNNHKPIKEKVEKEKRTATATRLPKDWMPSIDDLNFCKTERPELDPASVASQFRDYWVAVSGSKGTKLDWPATWRNWVRNQKQATSPVSLMDKPKIDTWWSSDAGIDRKGRELRMMARPNENYSSFKDRIFEALKNQPKAMA